MTLNKPSRFLRCSLAILLPLALQACVSPVGPASSQSQHFPVYQPLTHSIALNAQLPLAEQLAGQLDGIAGSQALIEYGSNVDAERKQQLRAALLQAGVVAAAQRWQFGAGDHTLRLTISRQQAHAPGCYQPLNANAATLSDGKWFGVRAVSSQLGCSVNANLAAQLVRPEDLNDPAALDAPNAVRAVGAVEAYQRGKVRELNEQKFEAGSGASGGM